mmetsp:Transcript_110553/g.309011  ORF Transcript_110553/g.309011 Transcript_110553/m.309011 type:complete len:217 (-) Transcript_110553:111-761(-)
MPQHASKQDTAPCILPRKFRTAMTPSNPAMPYMSQIHLDASQSALWIWASSRSSMVSFCASKKKPSLRCSYCCTRRAEGATHSSLTAAKSACLSMCSNSVSSAAACLETDFTQTSFTSLGSVSWLSSAPTRDRQERRFFLLTSSLLCLIKFSILATAPPHFPAVTSAGGQPRVLLPTIASTSSSARATQDSSKTARHNAVSGNGLIRFISLTAVCK